MNKQNHNMHHGGDNDNPGFLFQNTTKLVPPLGIEMKPHITAANIDLDIITPCKKLSSTSWQLV